MTGGRADEPDTTVKPPIVIATPIDEVVIRVGIASMVLGSVVVLVANATRPGVGSLGAVPEALTGLQALCLGWFAVVLAHPSWGGPRPGRAGWFLVVAGIVATAAVVVVALDDVGVSLGLAPSVAQLIVALGRAVIVGGLTWLSIVLVFAGLGYLWRQILAAGADRWIR